MLDDTCSGRLIKCLSLLRRKLNVLDLVEVLLDSREFPIHRMLFGIDTI